MSARCRWIAVLLMGAGVTASGCTEPGGDSVSIRMGNDERFHPSVIEVPVGGTATWRNDGAEAHTATSITTEREPSGEFDSGEVTGTGTFSHTFDEPGAYLYQCMLHGEREMVGVVEVVG